MPMLVSGPLRPISDSELRGIVQLVYDASGINLQEGKRELVEARLQKRMRQLGLHSYRDYLALVDGDDTGEERQRLLDAVATNFTSFLREPAHFDFLRQRIATEAVARGRDLSIWCAASSSGEEPVTIAVTLREAGCKDFSILASDISHKALTVARRGVYPAASARAFPLQLLRRYFERGEGEQEGLARVKADLRAHVTYQALNLIEEQRLGRTFDAIFCRNVMIYFDRQTQQRVVAMLERHLAPGGHLFISHSESLNGISHGLTWVAPAIYRRTRP